MAGRVAAGLSWRWRALAADRFGTVRASGVCFYGGQFHGFLTIGNQITSLCIQTRISGVLVPALVLGVGIFMPVFRRGFVGFPAGGS
jgi:hypothetical protein